MPICCLEFDTLGHYLVTSGDKNINVFHNIVGFRAQIAALHEKKRMATGPTHRQRIQEQINEAWYVTVDGVCLIFIDLLILPLL